MKKLPFMLKCERDVMKKSTKLHEEKQQTEMLLQQMEELELQETKATKLKEEQENLLK